MLKRTRNLVILGVSTLALFGLIQHLSRGPDFDVTWTRSVPSFLPESVLGDALKDTRNWPIFHHELKEAELYRVSGSIETRVIGFDVVEPGMRVTLKMEPKGKEWKRYELRAEITEVQPGKSVSFRLLPESQGKVAKVLDSYEWSFGVGAPSDDLRAKKYQGMVSGTAKAHTLTGRARFFGRIASRVLMNQTYPVDLVRLANFEENKEARARDYAPVYK